LQELSKERFAAEDKLRLFIFIFVAVAASAEVINVNCQLSLCGANNKRSNDESKETMLWRCGRGPWLLLLFFASRQNTASLLVCGVAIISVCFCFRGAPSTDVRTITFGIVE
jgi:hypothetical protein